MEWLGLQDGQVVGCQPLSAARGHLGMKDCKVMPSWGEVVSESGTL